MLLHSDATCQCPASLSPQDKLLYNRIPSLPIADGRYLFIGTMIRAKFIGRIILSLLIFVFGDRNWRPGRFRRSVKESLNGPFQANRSDGTKPGIGIERKNKPTFSVNMYIKSGYFKSNFPISFLTMMQEIRLICL